MEQDFEDKSLLILDNERVLYYNDSKSRYGASVAIDIFGPDDPLGSGERIRKWYAENNIGDGYPKTKPREMRNTNMTVEPCYFRISSWTKIIDLDGHKLTEDELRPGVKIGLVAKACPYNNIYGQGTTYSLEQIIVYEPKFANVDYLKQFKQKSAKIEKLRAEREEAEKEHSQDESDSASLEEKEATGGEQGESTGQTAEEKGGKEDIDLSSLPF